MDADDLLYGSSSEGDEVQPEGRLLSRVSATIRRYQMIQPRSQPYGSVFDMEDPIIKWEVVCGGLPGRGDWTLWVTYEDFAELDKSLRKRHKGPTPNPIAFFKDKFGKDKDNKEAKPAPRKVPEFAPRAWLRDDLSPEFLSERAEALQLYLDRVLALFPDDPSLERFLMPLPEEDQRRVEAQQRQQHGRGVYPVYGGPQHHDHHHQPPRAAVAGGAHSHHPTNYPPRQQPVQHFPPQIRERVAPRPQPPQIPQRFAFGSAPCKLPQIVGEVWLEALFDGVVQSLRILNAVFDKIKNHSEIAVKLQILEENGDAMQSCTTMLSESLTPLRQASVESALPPQLVPFLERVVAVIEEAMEWASSAESTALMSLSQSEVVTGEQEDGAPEPVPVVVPHHNDDDAHHHSIPRVHVNEMEPPAYEEPEVVSKDQLLTIKGCTEKANVMVVEAVSIREKQQVNRLRDEKRRFLKKMEQAREKSSSVQQKSDWTTLIDFVKNNVVPSVNVQEIANALELVFYSLVDQRAALEPGANKGASVLMHSLRDLRGTLRSFKAELLKEHAGGGGFIESIINSVTDLQENACNLQLELERNYQLEADLEDVVIKKVQQKTVKEKRNQAQRAQDDLFSL